MSYAPAACSRRERHMVLFTVREQVPVAIESRTDVLVSHPPLRRDAAPSLIMNRGGGVP